jgi:large subunit ribosomal protein L46
LEEAAGVDMNTWLVGRLPIGHLIKDGQTSSSAAKEANGSASSSLPDKTFYLKARIMAGQVNLKGNKLGLQDWKWLCKEEVKDATTPSYWRRVQDMLSAR